MVGGASSGNCATGRNGMQTAPAITMKRDVTVEKTGRLIKKSANNASVLPQGGHVLLLNLDGHSVGQVLASGDDDIVSGLETADHLVVVARNITERKRNLPRDFLPVLLFGNECKELPADACYRYHWYRDPWLCAPGDTSPHQLLRAQSAVGGLIDWRLRQYGLSRRIDLR